MTFIITFNKYNVWLANHFEPINRLEKIYTYVYINIYNVYI